MYKSIQKYIFLAIKQQESNIKILSRNRKNGNYYNIHIYKTNSDFIYNNK